MVAFSHGSVIKPDQLARLLERAEAMLLVDVRTFGEYDAGHIRGARNIPLGSLGEHFQELRAEPQTPVVLVCRSGARARTAEGELRAAGMRRVLVLAGGMNAWAAAGQHVAEAAKPEVSSGRRVGIVAGSGLVLLGGVLGVFASTSLALLAAGVGAGLLVSGLTGTCMISALVSQLPCARTTSGGAGCSLRSSPCGADAAGAGDPTPSTGR